MKKIFMFLCCVVFASNAFASGSCQYVKNLDSINNTNFDERLDVGGNAGYICDANIGGRECPYHTTFVTKNGVWNCHDNKGAIDAWLNVSSRVKPCTFDMISGWLNDGGVVDYAGKYFLQQRVFTHKDGDVYMHPADGIFGSVCTAVNGTSNMLSCLKAQQAGQPAIWNDATGKCSCGSVGDVNYTWNEAQGKCVSGSSDKDTKTPNTANKKSCDGTEHGKSKMQKCPSSIAGGNECNGTCNDGKWSNWKIISCDTKGYEATPKNNECVKKSGGGNDDHGGVVPSEDKPVESFTCLDKITPSDWRMEYAKCDNVIAAYTALEEYCAGEPIEAEYNARRTELTKLANACDDKMSRITRSTATITTAAQNLDVLIGNKVSAWKNAEGEFNTARLASDSIAGVVLGTAGGLITSHLVKKGQVKQGFEDISCTVGGQRVADWGDEFTVGIR